MLFMITLFVITATMAWVALDRANSRAVSDKGFQASARKIVRFAEL
ncbi:MAG: hypothetical protein JJ891_11495 [Rhizobiaceae bacterium]|jgi:hypothetical protein|nr:hypothetical protein [Rhizobiaceae bacterium]